MYLQYVINNCFNSRNNFITCILQSSLSRFYLNIEQRTQDIRKIEHNKWNYWQKLSCFPINFIW